MIALLLIAAVAQPQPLTLERALELAKANPHLAQAIADQRAANARIDEARAGYFPSASASIGDSLSNSQTPQLGIGTEGGPANLFSSSLTLDEMLWDFGRTRSAVDAARAQARSTATELSLAQADLALNVKTAYFSALAAEALEKSAEETLASTEKHLKLAQVREQVGSSPPYDVTKAKIDRGNAQLALVQAKNNVQLARAQLSHAIGQDIGEATLVAPAPSTAAAPPLAQAIETAVAHRPEIQSLDAQLAADRANVAHARAAYYPSLSAGAQGAIHDFGSKPQTSWSVGATLSIPLLAGGADRARLGEAQALADSLAEARAVEVLDVRLDVQSTLVALDGARKAAQVAHEVVAEAQEGLVLAEGRYRAGAGNIVELSDAQAQLATAEAQAIQDDLNTAVDQAKLERSLGGG